MGLVAFSWASSYPADLSPMARLCLMGIANNGFPEEHPVDTDPQTLAKSWRRPVAEAADALNELERERALVVLDRDGDRWTVILTMPGWADRHQSYLDMKRWNKYDGKPVVYRLYSGDSLAYIGSTGNLRGRLAAHRSEGRIPFDEWYATIYESRADAYAQEARQIKSFGPPFNRAGVPR